MLHVFVDEVGDFGFNFERHSSRHFLIGFAFFPDEDYKQSVEAVKDTIQTISGKRPRELKFRSSSQRIREELLNRLVEDGGRFGYIYVKKPKIYARLRNHPEINYFYNQMLNYLIENLIKQERAHRDIIVYVDQRSSNKEIKKDLSTYLPRNINPILKGKRLYVRYERSHNSRGIQCADFVCGSAFRKIERNDDRYFEILKDSVIVKRELFRFKRKRK